MSKLKWAGIIIGAVVYILFLLSYTFLCLGVTIIVALIGIPIWYEKREKQVQLEKKSW